jgi:hypothetical protein
VAGDDEPTARLRLLAEDAARQNEGSAFNAQAVKSSRARAVEVISGATVRGEQAVWVIQVEGTERFTCVGCRRPRGAPSPRGQFLTLVVDARSFVQSDFGISDVKADLSQLGAVITILEQSR